MKDKQFLEQLNLYLDGEIDPADAAELEHEILASPARRRIYNDYCRIHRATKLVGEQFRAAGVASETDSRPSTRPAASAESAANLVILGGRTGGRAAPRPFRRLAFACGLAAACAVGVFIGTRVQAPRAAKPLAPAPAVAVAEPEVAAPVVTATAPAAAETVTFAAPFAPETRADPFVQFAPTRNDPFALTPWTIYDDASRSAPPSISNPPLLRVDPRFRPASLEDTTEAQGARENGPFRLRVNTPATGTVPADFSTQP
jgi:hypothetical protein